MLSKTSESQCWKLHVFEIVISKTSKSKICGKKPASPHYFCTASTKVPSVTRYWILDVDSPHWTELIDDWTVYTTELYYITGGSARGKKVSPKTWRILAWNDAITMGKTTDQAQFEPATVQTTPLVLAKIFIEFWSFCSKFQLFWYFWTHLFDFRLFESRTQYTRPRKTAKHHQNPEKFEKTRYFKSGYWQLKVSHVIDVLFLILKNTMGKNYTSRI